jgi:hypothetical protein
MPTCPTSPSDAYWIAEEKPEAVNRHIHEFLTR